MVWHIGKIKCIKDKKIVIDDKEICQAFPTRFFCELARVNHKLYLANKLSNGAAIITKAIKYICKDKLIQFYHSFIAAFLIYCIEI